MKAPVYIERGARRSFACSLEWPGLCRAGKGDEGALEALGTYLARYAPVAARAGVAFDLAEGVGWEVLQTAPTRSGGADFGVPTTMFDADAEPLTEAESRRFIALLEASWSYFDDVVAAAPPELRKGPRGGGRDRDAIASHVYGAEQMYGAKAGLKLPVPPVGDEATVKANRAQLVAQLQTGPAGLRHSGRATAKPWPPRYALRRLTWHVLDHAWEIEDRGGPGASR